jgi:hypothetical protein
VIHLSAELAVAASKVDRLPFNVHPADMRLPQEGMAKCPQRVQSAQVIGIEEGAYARRLSGDGPVGAPMKVPVIPINARRSQQIVCFAPGE